MQPHDVEGQRPDPDDKNRERRRTTVWLLIAIAGLRDQPRRPSVVRTRGPSPEASLRTGGCRQVSSVALSGWRGHVSDLNEYVALDCFTGGDQGRFPRLPGSIILLKGLKALDRPPGPFGFQPG